MAVLVLNPAVLAMDHQLGLLVLRDLPGTIHCILLAVEHLSVALGAGTPDSPAFIAGDDMLTTFAHSEAPYRSVIAAKWVCGAQIWRGHPPDRCPHGK